MNGSDPKQTTRELLEEAHPALIGLSHWIHANPEIGHEETLAAGWVAEWLTSAGFDVTTGASGMPTAVIGSTGPGPFHVAICAEYDALPEVGHACGHNVIAAAGVGAGVALATVAEELGLRVTVMGTPAEEGGGGKLRLIDDGAFRGVHAAMMVHPWPSDVLEPNVIAVRSLEITFVGHEAHAAGYPHLGRNAADALVIAQVAVGLLRQQLLPTDRVHGFVTKGGDAPNIIPSHTTAHFMVRATTRERMDELTVLVRRCFEAGALATGCEVAISEEVAYADMHHDSELAAVYRANAESLGRVFDDRPSMPVSTDMGDVSHVVPAIHPMIGIDAQGAVNHQHAFAAACVTPSADQAILDGALAMAWTVIDAAQDVDLRARLMGQAMVTEALEMAVEADQLEGVSEAVAEQADSLAEAADVLADEALRITAEVDSIVADAGEVTPEAVELVDEVDELQAMSFAQTEDAQQLAVVADALAEAAEARAEAAEAIVEDAVGLQGSSPAPDADVPGMAEAVADVAEPEAPVDDWAWYSAAEVAAEPVDQGSLPEAVGAAAAPVADDLEVSQAVTDLQAAAQGWVEPEAVAVTEDAVAEAVAEPDAWTEPEAVAVTEDAVAEAVAEPDAWTEPDVSADLEAVAQDWVEPEAVAEVEDTVAETVAAPDPFAWAHPVTIDELVAPIEDADAASTESEQPAAAEVATPDRGAIDEAISNATTHDRWADAFAALLEADAPALEADAPALEAVSDDSQPDEHPVDADAPTESIAPASVGLTEWVPDAPATDRPIMPGAFEWIAPEPDAAHDELEHAWSGSDAWGGSDRVD